MKEARGALRPSSSSRGPRGLGRRTPRPLLRAADPSGPARGDVSRFKAESTCPPRALPLRTMSVCCGPVIRRKEPRRMLLRKLDVSCRRNSPLPWLRSLPSFVFLALRDLAIEGALEGAVETPSRSLAAWVRRQGSRRRVALPRHAHFGLYWLVLVIHSVARVMMYWRSRPFDHFARSGVLVIICSLPRVIVRKRATELLLRDQLHHCHRLLLRRRRPHPVPPASATSAPHRGSLDRRLSCLLAAL